MLIPEHITNLIRYLTRDITMNTTNKTDPKAIATTETAKVNNNSVMTTQSEMKKPTFDVKKPEMPEKTPITDDKKPTVSVKETDKPSQIIPVVTKPDSTISEKTKVINKPVITNQPELKTPTVDVNKPELPETAPIANEKDPIVPVKPNQLIPVVTNPEPAKTESVNLEKSKNSTKSDKAKAIYDEMVKDPKNDRNLIIAKIKKELVLTKAGALSYFYKFQKESGNVTEKQPTKIEKAKEVYERMTLEGKSRKDIIAAFVKEVGLTPAGSSTYYQNLKMPAEKPTKS
jgi:hypothetical protein